MIKLRITHDGRVRGLWSDHLSFSELGIVHVRRASHVEFDQRSQSWFVREAVPKKGLCRLLQRLLGRPSGRVLFNAVTRSVALAWEHNYFQPGGPGWNQIRR